MPATRRFACAALLGAVFFSCADRATDPAPVPTEAAPVALAPQFCGEGVRCHAFGDVWLAAQPKAADLAAAKTAGVRTVVNLRTEKEAAGFDERKAVAELGLAYVHVPFGGPEELTDEVFDRIREALNKAERPLLLHCASANRVGAVWIPWRVLDGGKSLDEAVAEAKTIGLRTPALEEKARSYVAKRK